MAAIPSGTPATNQHDSLVAEMDQAIMLKMVYEYAAGCAFSVSSEWRARSEAVDMLKHKREMSGADLGIAIANKKPWRVEQIKNQLTGENEGEVHTLEVFVMTADELKKVVRAHNGEIY